MLKPGTISERRIFAFYIFLLAVAAFLSLGYAGGITGRTKKGGVLTGCYCHGKTPYNKVNVNITGPDTLSPGQTADYFLKITGGPLVRGGTDIAVHSGQINLTQGSGLKKIDGDLTHEFPKEPSDGEVSFKFSYTAPASEGVDTIFANGNSVNFDLLPYFDNWNFAPNKLITIKNPIGVINPGNKALSFSLEQNYPNPFNPVTLLRFELSEKAFAELEIFDLLGRKIETLISENLSRGIYKVKWDASNYPAGIYIYRLNTGSNVLSRKMTLIK